LFGERPVFIFDPSNRSNEAVTLKEDPSGEAGGNALEFWKIYPKVLRDTFTRAFTSGLGSPNARVTALDWLNTLVELRNSVFKCGCETPNYCDSSILTNHGHPPQCWHCGEQPKLPFRTRLGRASVMLNAGSHLYSHHMCNGNDDFDFSNAVAEVVQHPTDPKVWGLKNLSGEKWVFSFSSGNFRDVEPGRSVPLASGTRINFRSIEGVIEY
jgi:hypothetical protein